MKTILEQHIEKFAMDFNNPSLFTKDKEHHFVFGIKGFESIQVQYLDPGMFLSSPFHTLPKKNLETFYMHIMQANYLGQGTARSVISLEPNEKFLTLSMTIPYEVNYIEFKEIVEEFCNHLEYWKRQVDDFIIKQV